MLETLANIGDADSGSGLLGWCRGRSALIRITFGDLLDPRFRIHP
jgi:hypothetical protein